MKNTNLGKANNFFSFNFLKDLKWYEWGIILMMSIAQLFVAIFDNTSVGTAIFNYTITLSSFLYLVCASRCSFWIFVFGLYQPIAYGIVCLNAQLYGEMLVNFAYFAPMQIVGICLWLRNAKKAKNSNGEQTTNQVEIKKLQRKNYIWLIPFIILTYGCMYFILSQMNGQRLPYLDAFISIGYILGTLLLTLRYVENWYVYLVVNLVSCVLWIILALQGNGDGFYIFILDIAYVLYTIIGLAKWKKYSKTTPTTNTTKASENTPERHKTDV